MSEQEQNDDQFENPDLDPNENNLPDDGSEPNPELESESFDIVIEGEEPEEQEDEFSGQPAPEWVKDLRKKDRESQKRIKELEAKLITSQAPKQVELGEKPTLESVGYDTDLFEQQLTEWHSKKSEFDQQELVKKTEQETTQKQWQDRLTNYEVKKTAIKSKVNDYDEAEELARDALDKTQQGILIHGADNPEMLIYHLGKNPQKAKELASVKDPILFAFKLAKIDAQLKVQQRKPQTSPERKPNGSAPLSGAVDSKLEALEKEADRTGNRSKVIAYKKSLKK